VWEDSRSVYGLIRTVDSASNVPASNVLTSLLLFAGVYSFLLFCTLFFGSRILRKGPNLALAVPSLENQPAVEVELAEHIPDRRPVETQSEQQ
jgi:cytochrome bd ubiquinol oxidase subunit I